MLSDTARDLATVRELLRGQLAGEAIDLRQLKGGVFSRAYACTVSGAAYVVRLNAAPHAAVGFAKDVYAWRHFASPALPIPRVVATGQIGGDQFAISERAAGSTQQELPPDERLALLPATLDTFDIIFGVDVRGTRGFGHWGTGGTGQYPRWRDYLAAIIDNETEGFYRDWHTLFRDSFLERDAYETIYRHLLRLLPHCPEERALLHNDLHFENVLADSGRITGVIDWANALYGDPLYEIARLLWWTGWPGWWYDGVAPILHARYGAAPGYAERIACYTCHFVLDDFRYYATMGLRAEYVQARDRILEGLRTED